MHNWHELILILQEVDDGAGGAGAIGEQIVEVTPSPGFDLETYISNYTGRTRATRLKFIAVRVPSLQKDAFRLQLILFESDDKHIFYGIFLQHATAGTQEWAQRSSKRCNSNFLFLH